MIYFMNYCDKDAPVANKACSECFHKMVEHKWVKSNETDGFLVHPIGGLNGEI